MNAASILTVPSSTAYIRYNLSCPQRKVCELLLAASPPQKPLQRPAKHLAAPQRSSRSASPPLQRKAASTMAFSCRPHRPAGRTPGRSILRRCHPSPPTPLSLPRAAGALRRRQSAHHGLSTSSEPRPFGGCRGVIGAGLGAGPEPLPRLAQQCDPADTPCSDRRMPARQLTTAPPPLRCRKGA